MMMSRHQKTFPQPACLFASSSQHWARLGSKLASPPSANSSHPPSAPRASLKIGELFIFHYFLTLLYVNILYLFWYIYMLMDFPYIPLWYFLYVDILYPPSTTRASLEICKHLIFYILLWYFYLYFDILYPSSRLHGMCKLIKVHTQ